MAVTGGTAGNIPVVPPRAAHTRGPRDPACGQRRPGQRRARVALERPGGGDPAARCPRLYRRGPRGQGLSGHQGQRVGIPHRVRVELRSAYGATVHTDGVAHPGGSDFGAWPIILGTIQSSAIALIFALPISIGAAFALTERLPRWITRPLGFAIEILAGIPSVVIGLWGLLALGPFLAKHVYPIIADHAPNVPVLRYFRNPVGTGEGLLTAGIVLGMMIVPIIASTTRDLFTQVPDLPKEGGAALGMTDFEVARRSPCPGCARASSAPRCSDSDARSARPSPWSSSGVRSSIRAQHLLALHDDRRHHLEPTRRCPNRRHRIRCRHLGRAGPRAGRHLGHGQYGGESHHQPIVPQRRPRRARRLRSGRDQLWTSRHTPAAALGDRFFGRTYLAFALIIAPAAWLLISVVAHAAPHWQWSVLTQPLKGQTGGLRDQILGTLILMLGVLIMAGTVGVLARNPPL